nr:sulfite exporter TauE/SafE family protein [uncultured Gellertiella sp.]
MTSASLSALTPALLPDTLTATSLAFLLAAALIGGMARGFSGFGGALIFMPLASVVIEPKLAAAVLLVADGFTALTLIPGALRTARSRDAFIMASGALIGVPLGTAILAHVAPVMLRWGISLTVGLLLALLASGWRYRGRASHPVTIFVGFLSGLFSGAAQLGGPPVVAYFLGRDMPGLMIRANIILYFAVSTMISAASYGLNGLLTLHALGLAVLVAPVFSLGLYGGSRLFGRASDQTFRRVCYSLIAGAALIGLPALDAWLR